MPLWVVGQTNLLVGSRRPDAKGILGLNFIDEHVAERTVGLEGAVWRVIQPSANERLSHQNCFYGG